MRQKDVYIANDYAVSFCGNLKGRQLVKVVGNCKVTWKDAITNKVVFVCNDGFAKTHFTKVKKHV